MLLTLSNIPLVLVLVSVVAVFSQSPGSNAVSSIFYIRGIASLNPSYLTRHTMHLVGMPSVFSGDLVATPCKTQATLFLGNVGSLTHGVSVKLGGGGDIWGKGTPRIQGITYYYVRGSTSSRYLGCFIGRKDIGRNLLRAGPHSRFRWWPRRDRPVRSREDEAVL